VEFDIHCARHQSAAGAFQMTPKAQYDFNSVPAFMWMRPRTFDTHYRMRDYIEAEP
jgi:hypothetical protein